MDYRCVTDPAAVKTYLQNANIVAFDFETSPLPKYRDDPRAALDANKAHIVGVSFSVEEGSAIYVPLRHRTGTLCDAMAMTGLLMEFSTNPHIIKVAHNLAFESMFLYAQGIILQPPCYDTLAAAQMTLKSNTEFRKLSDSGLKKLATELLDAEMPSFGAVTDGRHFDELDPQEAETIRYACADADYALRLYHLINGWFDTFLPRHRFMVEQVESPTSVYCGLMKHNGLLMDRPAMLAQQAKAEAKLSELREQITFFIGDVDIGANAGTQAFKDYLFKDLGLPVLKTTEKLKEAADDSTMILLAEWCLENRPELVPLFELVQEYRKWSKIMTTYIAGFLQHINTATGRIHPDLMPLATETGRFASRNPNLQNCFDKETEILTWRGFVHFHELKADDLVAQWENGEVYFVKPIEQIAYEYSGDMIQLRNQHIDLCITPEHRCLLQNRKNHQYFVVPAYDYCSDAKQLHAAQYAFGDKHMTSAEITLLAATQADGYYHDGGIDFTFSKARKYRRLTNALRELTVPHSDYVKADGRVSIRVLKGEISERIIKLLGEGKVWGKWLLEYDRQTIKGILAELPEWDGCFTRGNHYSSSVKQNADWMQTLYVLTGTRAHLRKYHNGNPNSVVNFQLDITDRNYSLTSNIQKETVPYSGMVYCVTVPSGYIMVRRNGQVCITGNCPRKDNDPIGVRSFILAPEGKLLLSLDFSQIELRVGAFYCRDEKMLETYRQNGDIHAQTTAVIYRIPFEEAVDKHGEHYKERRTIAKNCNFGVFYGLYAKGLHRTLKFKAGLDKPLPECEEIIRSLKAGYPALDRWQEEVKQRAALRRYTETWLGRRRYLPGISSADWVKKSYAERIAMNTPIQGTAADILKLALGRIVAGLPERVWLRPLLQIHDELLFELPTDRLGETVDFIRACMEAQPFPEFDVPIIAEAACGPDFGHLLEAEQSEAGVSGAKQSERNTGRPAVPHGAKNEME